MLRKQTLAVLGLLMCSISNTLSSIQSVRWQTCAVIGLRNVKYVVSFLCHRQWRSSYFKKDIIAFKQMHSNYFGFTDQLWHQGAQYRLGKLWRHIWSEQLLSPTPLLCLQLLKCDTWMKVAFVVIVYSCGVIKVEFPWLVIIMNSP